MICRDYQNGSKLNVGNLNEITVLIDRSEANLTEVALNHWRSGLYGPPHSHAGKEQVFFITDGEGIVHLGGESHPVKPGSLIYVPEGVVHQTVTHDRAMTYFLFNAFLDPNKEGCANYAEHIEKVRAIRQQQAATGNAASDPNLSKRISARKPRSVVDVRGTTSAVLVSRMDTDACEVERVGMSGNSTRTAQLRDCEQTLFILAGSGKIEIDDQQCGLHSGKTVFIPENATQSVTAGEDGLVYLSLSSFAYINQSHKG
jgi:mannose-6-phosphate isomerase-like protein (cupin superfamily)